ncbi:hypothetical protein M3Y97_00908900 [Aphelenchoides bicaudatus]|nr:hypothetical protein M3Y97_00908900 [Aphelenchoides bicaudatus]
MSSMKALILAILACMIIFATASPISRSLPFGTEIQSDAAPSRQNNPAFRIKRNVFDDAFNEMAQFGSEIFHDVGEDAFQDDVEHKD